MIKVKITHPIITNSGRLDAGQIVEVADEIGAAWIGQEMAIEVKDEPVEPVKQKKVKHGNG